MKHEFHTAPGRPLEPQSHEFDSPASPNPEAASPPTQIAYDSPTSTPPPPSHRPPKILPAHTPSSISCRSVADRSAGLPMEFPDRPIGRENPNSLSLEAAPPAHLNSGSGTGPKRALKANTQKPLARSAKNPSSLRLPASAGLVPRKPAPGLHQHQSVPTPRGIPTACPLKHP